MKPFSGRDNSLELPGFALSNSLLYVLKESRELTALVSWVGFRSTDIQNFNKKNCHFFFHFEPPGGSYEFFRNPPHQNWYPPWDIPRLKNEAPHLKNNPPPLKHEAPYHEMIPRKCTINNDLKSAYNPSKICVNKFIFNKFAGLLAYSHQLYYQMNTYQMSTYQRNTGIFWQHFKSPSPHSPSNFEEPPTQMFSTAVGNPD